MIANKAQIEDILKIVGSLIYQLMIVIGRPHETLLIVNRLENQLLNHFVKNAYQSKNLIQKATFQAIVKVP